jgi:hypothetical protein
VWCVWDRDPAEGRDRRDGCGRSKQANGSRGKKNGPPFSYRGALALALRKQHPHRAMADTPTSPPTVPEAHARIARTTRPSPADALAVLKEAAAGQKLRAGSAVGGVGKKKGARGGGPARRASEPAVREVGR